MTSRQYAQALHLALRDANTAHEEIILERFFWKVKEHDHEKLLPKILRKYSALVRRSVRAEIVTLTSATPISDQTKESIVAASDLITNSARVQHHVDPNIIAGHIIRTQTHRADASAKHQLLAIFQSAIA